VTIPFGRRRGTRFSEGERTRNIRKKKKARTKHLGNQPEPKAPHYEQEKNLNQREGEKKMWRTCTDARPPAAGRRSGRDPDLKQQAGRENLCKSPQMNRRSGDDGNNGNIHLGGNNNPSCKRNQKQDYASRRIDGSSPRGGVVFQRG